MPVSTPTPHPVRKKPVPVKRRRKSRKKCLQRQILRLSLCALVLVSVVGLFIQIPKLFHKKSDKPYTKGEGPWCIALDAGHGGKDSGASGIIQEVELTEATVHQLQSILNQDKRFKVVLCREFGETVEKPSERAISSNKQGADLLLSVHGNSDPTGEAYGFECYPVPPGRELADFSLEFGQLLAESFEQAGARLRGTEGIRYAYYEGEENDVKVIREGSDKTIYETPSFGILEVSKCPAVLAEQCFITNQGDFELFGTQEGIARAANAYYQAICHFFEVEPMVLQ